MFTHQIVSMTRAETKNSKSPMWRCKTADGESVNVFQHHDPTKDTASLFEGYIQEMLAMQVGQELRWTQHPIPVFLQKNGQWWEVITVAPRSNEAKPDPSFVPNLELFKVKAIASAESLIEYSPLVVYWDLETSGTDRLDAEILSKGSVDGFGRILMDAFIRPDDMSRVDGERQKHGITAEQLRGCPTFPELYDQICALLDGKIWVIYNASFDPMILEYNCNRHGLVPPHNVGIVDAMQIFAEFRGEWDFTYQKFKPAKLTEAAEMFGIDTPNAHNALADALTTYHLIQEIASSGGNGA